MTTKHSTPSLVLYISCYLSIKSRQGTRASDGVSRPGVHRACPARPLPDQSWAYAFCHEPVLLLVFVTLQPSASGSHGEFYKDTDAKTLSLSPLNPNFRGGPGISRGFKAGLSLKPIHVGYPTSPGGFVSLSHELLHLQGLSCCWASTSRGSKPGLSPGLPNPHKPHSPSPSFSSEEPRHLSLRLLCPARISWCWPCLLQCTVHTDAGGSILDAGVTNSPRPCPVHSIRCTRAKNGLPATEAQMQALWPSA